MKLHVAGTTYTGAVVDLRTRNVDGRPRRGHPRAESVPVVSCPDPPSVYSYAGLGPSIDETSNADCVAAAARSGDTRRRRTRRHECHAQLAELECSPPDCRTPRASPYPIDGLSERRYLPRVAYRSADARRERRGGTGRFRDAATELSERETRQLPPERHANSVGSGHAPIATRWRNSVGLPTNWPTSGGAPERPSLTGALIRSLGPSKPYPGQIPAACSMPTQYRRPGRTPGRQNACTGRPRNGPVRPSSSTTEVLTPPSSVAEF